MSRNEYWTPEYLSTEEKWAPVDYLINRMNERTAHGKRDHYTELEEYVDSQFNHGRNTVDRQR